MKELLTWFDLNKRDLPWRQVRSAYRTWVSEMMLQQTRVETVIPYFERWMERFPDVRSLAEASEQDVLKLWEGLGYYSRARSLHKAAQAVMTQYNGDLPRDAALLRKLPGIGPYSAGAIASIGYGLPEAALDGNIRRILTRLYDIPDPVRLPETEKRLWQLAGELLDRERPGDHNEALMDLGAVICLPAQPRCLICPVRSSCLALEHGTAAERPVILKAEPIPHYIVTAAVIRNEKGEYLLTKRPAKGLLGGMWEFPGGKQEAGESLEDCIIREIREELGCEIAVDSPFGVYKHAYTHFKVTLHAFCCHILDGTPKPLASDELRRIPPEALSDLPMGKIDRMISDQLTASASRP